MSPPTDSHGPTDDMTRTERGPHCSKASYSGDSMPAGLSAAMSGRCGTKFRVTARPQAFWPLPSGRAPSMVASGQPITHRPSMSDWVESVPSLSSSSSETEPPTAANWQQMRWVANGMGLTGEAMLVDGDGCTGAHRHEPALRLGRRREAGRRPSCPTQDGGQHRRGFATCEVSAGITPPHYIYKGVSSGPFDYSKYFIVCLTERKEGPEESAARTRASTPRLDRQQVWAAAPTRTCSRRDTLA